MNTVDYSVLDNPEASARSFHPMRGWTETPPGAVDYGVTVADGATLSCRFFAVGRENPTVLFFYGGGESVARYDDIAPHYNEIGANFLSPTTGALGRPVVRRVQHHTVGRAQRAGLAAGDHAGASVHGPAIRHGALHGSSLRRGACHNRRRPDQRRHPRERAAQPGTDSRGAGAGVVQALEDDYQAKFYSIDIPALVIHGQWDESAPLADAVDMFNKLETAHKHLEIIPGAATTTSCTWASGSTSTPSGASWPGTPGRAQRLRPQAKPPSRGGSETSRGTRFHSNCHCERSEAI